MEIGMAGLHNKKLIEVADNGTLARRLGMYCVFETIQHPYYDSPFIASFDVFTTIDEANAKVEALTDAFINDYAGEVYNESEPNGPIRVITNDDVTGFIYLREY